MHIPVASLVPFVYFFVIVICAIKTPIEEVDDSDLLHLLTAEHNVITLFTKDNCQECDDFEALLDNIHDDLKNELGAVIVKAHNSHMVSIYDPTREPSLIYFRRGIPLLYYGEINEDEIIRTFFENREPVVKELSDSNFEHLTQAATGATTGDWFIFFYSTDCVLCQRLYAVWEAVGAKLKRRQNLARVNRLEGGVATAKRFGVSGSPEFILLRQGKVYRYKSKNYTPQGFLEFSENGYSKQTHPEMVPPVQSFMNDFIGNGLKDLATNSNFVIYGVMITTIIAFIILCKYTSKSPSRTEKKNKKAK